MKEYDFNNIVFIPDYISEYSTITAILLSKVNHIFKIGYPSSISDWIGFTYFHYDSLEMLKKLREQYPNHKIIVGGLGVIKDYHRIFEYADYCYFGNAFIFDVNSIATKDSKSVQINREIPFDRIPIIPHSKKGWMFYVEQGCPYRCEFCFMSSCNKYQKMNDDRIQKAIMEFEKRYTGHYVTLISNEGHVRIRNADFFRQKFQNTYNTTAAPIKRIIQNADLFSKQFTYHIGLELPTYKLRKQHLPIMKQTTDDELREFLANKYGNMITLYLIYNYYSARNDDYNELFNLLSLIAPIKKRVEIDFTTLKIEPHTKIANISYQYLIQLINCSIDFPFKQPLKPYRITKPRGIKKIVSEMLYTWIQEDIDITMKQNDTTISYYERINKQIDIEKAFQQRLNKRIEGDILTL